MTTKIQSFVDLLAWREAHKLTLTIYRATKNFPSDENFGLTNQMRRAAVSVASNLAEGFSRQSKKEKKQFYSIGKSSLTELQNQLIIARDLNYLNNPDFQKIFKISVQCSKLTSGLIKSVANRPLNTAY
ncbi:MAG: four helix bundle protein [Patescibacteria group bacterium]|jgi:four helix bundle protein